MPETSKPMWTRCPGCKDRIYNDKLDIGIHRGHCPKDLQLALQELGRKFDQVLEKMGDVESALDEQPAVAIDDVAPWPGDDGPLDEDDIEDGTNYDLTANELMDEDEDEVDSLSTPNALR